MSASCKYFVWTGDKLSIQHKHHSHIHVHDPTHTKSSLERWCWKLTNFDDMAHDDGNKFHLAHMFITCKWSAINISSNLFYVTSPGSLLAIPPRGTYNALVTSCFTSTQRVIVGHMELTLVTNLITIILWQVSYVRWSSVSRTTDVIGSLHKV